MCRYDDGLSGYSSWSPTAVHIAAPGDYIMSTLPKGATGYLSGTSMATPMVSGAAALLLSVGGPDMTTARLRQLLMDTAVRTAGLKGKVLSVSAAPACCPALLLYALRAPGLCSTLPRCAHPSPVRGPLPSGRACLSRLPTSAPTPAKPD